MRFPDFIQRFDDAVTVFLNVESASPPCDIIMTLVTHMGHGLAAAALTLAALYLAGGRRLSKELWKDFLLAGAALLLAGLAVQTIKFFYNRPRPLGGISNLPQLRDLLKEDLHWRSFPSGHSATAFAAAAFLSSRIAKLAPLFYGVAALVAVSRIYTGVHFPTDAIAGALIGFIAARIVVKLSDGNKN